MGDSREKSLRFDSNTDSVEGEKVFEEKRNYRSDITGMSVRLKSELVFEMRRNLQTTNTKGAGTDASDSTLLAISYKVMFADDQ